MFRSVTFCLGIICLLSLGACSGIGKTVEVAANNITDGDCRWRRYIEGGDLCRQSPPAAVVYEPLYCYRSVGKVDCYAKPQAGRDPVGQNKYPDDMVVKTSKKMP